MDTVKLVIVLQLEHIQPVDTLLIQLAIQSILPQMEHLTGHQPSNNLLDVNMRIAIEATINALQLLCNLFNIMDPLHLFTRIALPCHLLIIIILPHIPQVGIQAIMRLVTVSIP